VAAGLTLLAYLVRQMAAGREAWRRRTSRGAMILLSATLLLAALGVALPALLWASSWVTWKLGFSLRPAAAVGSLTVVTTYLGAVVALFWRKRTTIAKAAGTVTGAASKGPANMVLPNSMIQLILMWICLAFLILVALLFCGWAATSALAGSIWALVPAGALAVLAVIIDQTSLSLHPFYRRRLARAFAVRRVRRDHADVAVRYSDDEGTWLDTYAEPVPGFPAATFAATANITGQDRTPPGRGTVHARARLHRRAGHRLGAYRIPETSSSTPGNSTHTRRSATSSGRKPRSKRTPLDTTGCQDCQDGRVPAGPSGSSSSAAVGASVTGGNRRSRRSAPSRGAVVVRVTRRSFAGRVVPAWLREARAASDR